jgi:hypothetical protein
MINKNYGEDSCDLEHHFNILAAIQHLILENMGLLCYTGRENLVCI